MKEFIVRLFSLLAIVGVFFGYNEVLDVRAKDEEIAKLNAQLEVQSSGAGSDSESGSDSGDGAGYKDGTYTGEADGFGGTVAVEVTVKNGKIEAVEVTSAEKEDGAHLAMAEDIIPKIIEAQSAEVDTISGATFSSTGIKNAAAHIFVYAYLLIALLPQFCIIETSFRNTEGIVFKAGHSLGSYVSAFSKMGLAIRNSLTLGLIALVFIVFLSVLIAYVTVRRPGILTGGLDIATMFPYIVPGSVLGISLITAFNQKPLMIAGTAAIIVVAFTIKRMPYTIRSSAAILRQTGISVEEASLSLGASKIKTFFRVTLPMMGAGVISGAIMSWITIITELSSSILLYTGKTKTMTIAIYSEVIRGNYGIAAALSTILTVITICSIFILFKVTGTREISM